MSHNGWANYATWGVALMLDNDQGTHTYVREYVEELRELTETHPNVVSGIWTMDEAMRFQLADRLSDFTEELCGLDGEDLGIPEPSLMAQQILRAGLCEVDWDEIARHYLDD